MKFIYIGDKDAPRETKVFGYEFTLNGPAVEVTDPHAQKKLSGNPTFKVADGKTKETVSELLGETIVEDEDLEASIDEALEEAPKKRGRKKAA